MVQVPGLLIFIFILPFPMFELYPQASFPQLKDMLPHLLLQL